MKNYFYVLMSEDCDILAISKSLDKIERAICESFADSVLEDPDTVTVREVYRNDNSTELSYTAKVLDAEPENFRAVFGEGYHVSKVEEI